MYNHLRITTIDFLFTDFIVFFMKFLEQKWKHDKCINTLLVKHMHTRHILSTHGFARRVINTALIYKLGSKSNQNEYRQLPEEAVSIIVRDTTMVNSKYPAKNRRSRATAREDQSVVSSSPSW